MDLDFSSYFSQAMRMYNSSSQIAREVTESWARDNLYCPRCGSPLQQYKDNTKVYDFYCNHSNQIFVLLPSSKDDFQLKSTKSFPHNYFPSRIMGAEYHTTVRSLREGTFPSLILLHYNPYQKEVRDCLFIHRLSVTMNSIGRRNPLGESARRRNWVGSEILLNNIPEVGRIEVIQAGEIVPTETVMNQWTRVENILKGDFEKRGWISDVMRVIDGMQETFTLEDVYSYESGLEDLHPDNKHIKDKIRQQLQILRDISYLKFISRGKYQKLKK
ncbi:MAG: hypothetical protein M1163_01655 [Candidatus Thermoplasmatota archaeon]|nr:hypothetical protein [Candidatus Thermoplasmatota archaeon]